MSNFSATPGDQLSNTTLTESHIHTHLRSRFYRDIIHTHISDDILLAVNPYTSQPSLDVEEIEQAAEALMQQSFLDSQPHVATLAAYTRARMRWSGESQHIVVHGESGAGKSHAIDSMLHQLFHGDPQISSTTRRKVVAARVVLDAFEDFRNSASSSRIKLNYTHERDHTAVGASSSSSSSAAASRAYYDCSEQPHQPVTASLCLHSVSFSQSLHQSDRTTVDASRRRYRGVNCPVFRYLIDACHGVMTAEDTQPPPSPSSSSTSPHNDNDYDLFNRAMIQMLHTSATLLRLLTTTDR